MSFKKLKAIPRTRSGKGPARRLRANGLAPAILYGAGVESTKICISPRELIKALSGPHRVNTVLDIELEGHADPFSAIVRDHHYDPVTRELLHVDFLAVGINQLIDLEVPFEVEGRSVGEQLGGNLAKKRRSLPVQCKPSDIPAAIKLDVSKIGLNETFTAAELIMPEGVTLRLAGKTPLVTVVAKGAADADKAAEDAASAEA